MRTTVARLVAVSLLLAACNGAAEEPAESSTTAEPSSTTSSTSTSSTTSTSTPTTVDARETSLLNGLPVDDPTLLDRRVMAVKIDNHERANPQSGINLADMVIELNVEGITRFISLWHESDSDYLGPNRSARPTDAALLPAFNEPTFVFSGGQGWVQNMVSAAGINMIKEGSEGTFRISSRRAPHNLYVDTFVLRNTADERGYADNPPEGPMWEFGPLEPTRTASEVDIEFRENDHVVWTWDDTQGLWLRTAKGRERMYRDEDGTEGRIGFPVLVALYTEPYTVNGLPSSITTGQGQAFVFADGMVAEGTWERETETDWFTLRTESGSVMAVPPGQSWVSLVPSNRGLAITE